jgi:hypothetical protein
LAHQNRGSSWPEGVGRAEEGGATVPVGFADGVGAERTPAGTIATGCGAAEADATACAEADAEGGGEADASADADADVTGGA